MPTDPGPREAIVAAFRAGYARGKAGEVTSGAPAGGNPRADLLRYAHVRGYMDGRQDGGHPVPSLSELDGLTTPPEERPTLPASSAPAP